MTGLVLKSIAKSYDGKNLALQNINLEVQEGEFVVLVGPSGCGKSTLLRIVAGLETASSGHIFIGDEEVTKLEPKDRHIAMVFQNYALYPHMSVYDNIAYSLKVRGLKKAEIEERVQATAKILELETLLKRRPRDLSGGQRQRVAMGRAIIRQPEVFLFDEPLSNLDTRLRVQMRFELKQLQSRLKTTSLYVTHDQVEAMTMADRVVVMNRGQIEQVGTPEEIYRKPETVFVAKFMGSPGMNLLTGEISEDGSVFYLSDQVFVELPEKYRYLGGRKVKLGVRPELIKVNYTSSDADKLVAVVEGVEMLGADNIAYLSLESQRIAVRLPYDEHPAIGSKLALSLPNYALHFFDLETKKRLVRPA